MYAVQVYTNSHVAVIVSAEIKALLLLISTLLCDCYAVVWWFILLIQCENV